MQLSSFILLLIVCTAMLTAGLQLSHRLASAGRRPTAAISTSICVVLVSLLFLAMCLRSAAFGVDTVTYSGIFQNYCAGQAINDSELSFTLSAQLINIGMLGRCDPVYLPASWIACLCAILLLQRGQWQNRIQFTALLLLSMVGIELSTNALRQGVADAFLICALSYWRRNNILAAAFALSAVAFHPSSALVILCCLLATLRFHKFLLFFSALAGAVILALAGNSEIAAGFRFFYEIQKYLQLDNDEIVIRILAYGSVLVTLAAPVLLPPANRSAVTDQPEFAMAAKLTLTCLPFLYLPYFGYRFVYGIFPMVLWLVLAAGNLQAPGNLRFFLGILFGNLAIVLLWSGGSSYMQSIPFLD